MLLEESLRSTVVGQTCPSKNKGLLIITEIYNYIELYGAILKEPRARNIKNIFKGTVVKISSGSPFKEGHI